MSRSLYHHDSTLFRIRNRTGNLAAPRTLSLLGKFDGEWAAPRLQATRFVVTYRVYSGPKGSADVSPLEKSQLLFKQLHTLDALLGAALEHTGRMPLLIEGDDGTRMDRRSIVDALRVGMREDVDGSASA